VLDNVILPSGLRRLMQIIGSSLEDCNRFQ